MLGNPWLFATAHDGRHSGPEHLCLGTLKYQVAGDRRVLLVDFESAVKFVRGTPANGATVSLKRVVDTVGEADAELLKKMCGPVKMAWADVGPDETLYTPWGWLVFEAALNRIDVYGIRWSVLHDQPTT